VLLGIWSVILALTSVTVLQGWMNIDEAGEFKLVTLVESLQRGIQ
jgi:hypothetical protein